MTAPLASSSPVDQNRTMTDDADRPLGTVLPLPQAPDAIELRHLRAFVAVADELNFGRAAARLYLSQPALSRQIRTLERLVGCDLLRRSTHRVELTLAGEALLDRARSLLRDVDDAVHAARAVGGELASRISRLLEPVADAADTSDDLQALRNAYEMLHAEFPPPSEVEVRPVNAGGVPSLLVTPGPERSVTMLYLHGGGYVLGSAFGYRALVGAVAVAADAGILLPEYRLAPEHPFPAALDDSLRAYGWMLDNGTQPERVTVAGDSSGGGLVLSLLVSLKLRGLPLPGRAALLCPWVDLTCAMLEAATDDPMLVTLREQGHRYAALYLAGHAMDDPVVDPLNADLTGLPPLLIQVGTGDSLRVEAHRLVERAREQGVDARLQLYPVDAHVFHLFWSFLPEAGEALRQVGGFARDASAVGTSSVDRGLGTRGGPPALPADQRTQAGGST
jgi:epsilon-lactone hydrolase